MGIPGIVALDKDKEIVVSTPFERNAGKILEKLEKLEKGKSVPEIQETLDELTTKNIVTELPIESDKFHIESKEKTSAKKYLKNNLRELSKKIGFVESDKQFNEILRDIQIIKTRKDIKSAVKKDKFLAQAISAFEDLRDTSNELSERLKEWYGLYYPEFKTNDNEKYVELVSEIGEREKFKEYKGSMGIDLDKSDTQILQKFAGEIQNMLELKERLDSYLEERTPDVAPNLTHLIGAKMTSKLISLAGSLEDLAKMPSSKIQLLGAEKALFRHLKGGGKPPKYGVIYNHAYIQKTPEGKRGKVARAIASKLMMAARTDFYTDGFKGEKYKEELENKIEKIRRE